MAADKVLVIDDEPGPRASLRMILKNQYEVLLSGDPLEGIEIAREQEPDVVFLDIKMPQMDGIEVLARLKDIDEYLEVAMITAYAAVDSAQQALRHGAIDYLTKPFSVDEVETVIERALERRKQRKSQQALLAQLQPTAQALSTNLDQLESGGAAPDQAAIFENLTSAHNSIEDQLNKIGRLTAIGEIAAEVAHDVGNFLSAILLRIEVLMLTLKQSPQVDADSIREALQDIVQAARDSAQAVKRISGMSRSDDPYEPSQRVDINEILEDAARLSLGRAKEDTCVQVTFDLGDVPEICGSPAALRTALTNLIINARQAIEKRGEIILRTEPIGDGVQIQVIDDGPGICEEVLQRITEPFFTTKGESGSGLGLSVANKIFRRHQGTMHFDTRVGEGTTITIRLPKERTTPVASDIGRTCDVMVIDDDVKLNETIARFLENAGMAAETFSSGPVALGRFEEMLEEPGGPPETVIVDLRMPDLLGTDLAQHIKELAPDTRIILLSGYLDSEDELASCPYLDVVLRKPCNLSDLLEEVHPGLQTPA